jgi:hypothetical protein
LFLTKDGSSTAPLSDADQKYSLEGMALYEACLDTLAHHMPCNSTDPKEHKLQHAANCTAAAHTAFNKAYSKFGEPLSLDDAFSLVPASKRPDDYDRSSVLADLSDSTTFFNEPTNVRSERETDRILQRRKVHYDRKSGWTGRDTRVLKVSDPLFRPLFTSRVAFLTQLRDRAVWVPKKPSGKDKYDYD